LQNNFGIAEPVGGADYARPGEGLVKLWFAQSAKLILNGIARLLRP